MRRSDAEPQPLTFTDEIVAEAIVGASATEVIGQTLGELRIHNQVGMEVLAIERGGRWLYRPRKTRTLEAGDRLLVVGPEEGAPRLRAWIGDPRPEHADHGWTEPEDRDQRDG